MSNKSIKNCQTFKKSVIILASTMFISNSFVNTNKIE